MLNSGIPIYIHCIPWTYMNIPLAASEHPCSRRHRSVDVATPHASAESGAGPSLWTSFILGVHSFKFYVALHGFICHQNYSNVSKGFKRLGWPSGLIFCGVACWERWGTFYTVVNLGESSTPQLAVSKNDVLPPRTILHGFIYFFLLFTKKEYIVKPILNTLFFLSLTTKIIKHMNFIPGIILGLTGWKNDRFLFLLFTQIGSKQPSTR